MLKLHEKKDTRQFSMNLASRSTTDPRAAAERVAKMFARAEQPG
jgi:hypothetical protein